jgi:regulator of sigma E protease
MVGEFGNFITPDVSFSIEFVKSDSPAGIAGIERGDRIVSIDGNVVRNFVEMKELLKNDDDGTVEIVIERKSESENEQLTKRIVLNDDRLLGILPMIDYPVTISRPTITEAINRGLPYAYSQIRSTIRILSNKPQRDRLDGPTRVLAAYRELSIAGPFIVFFAVLSFVPIPGTIFWSLCALLFEAIRGKTPSHQSVANAQKYGLYFIMILAALIIFSDVLRLVQSI